MTQIVLSLARIAIVQSVANSLGLPLTEVNVTCSNPRSLLSASHAPHTSPLPVLKMKGIFVDGVVGTVGGDVLVSDLEPRRWM